MEKIKIEIKGLGPLLMHGPRGLNKFDALTQELGRLTKKRTKTNDDLDEISRVEWALNMYFDEKLGPMMPTWNVRQSILHGARLRKLGKQIDRGLLPIEENVAIKYDGPRTLAEMWEEKERFLDLRPVGVGPKKVMRSRPIFHDWSLVATFTIDETQVDKKTVAEVTADAGMYCGLGDYKPRFGRYEVVRAS